mmetsp:Transcript_113408/g.316835  ORF Transcript_113408/g.316835 Transcript_113408/m.316835 type:complete len:204 (+) Transcript_113408:583-1194(+)
MTPTAALMLPRSTKFWANPSRLSNDASTRESVSHPAARPCLPAATPAGTKRATKNSTVATSFATIWLSRRGTMYWAVPSKLQAAKINLTSGLSASGITGSCNALLPSGHISAATIRATASPALLMTSEAGLSFSSGIFAASRNNAASTSGSVNLFAATTGSYATLQSTRMAFCFTAGISEWMASNRSNCCMAAPFCPTWLASL